MGSITQVVGITSHLGHFNGLLHMLEESGRVIANDDDADAADAATTQALPGDRDVTALEPKKKCKPWVVIDFGASADIVRKPAPEPTKKCKPSTLQDDPTLFAHFLQKCLNVPESALSTAAYAAEYGVMRSEWVKQITKRSTNSGLGDFLLDQLVRIKSSPQLTKNVVSFKILERFSESNEVDQYKPEWARHGKPE